ncbi:MAG: hypothetical protein AAGI38_20845 [Bacteroidota bacterium]
MAGKIPLILLLFVLLAGLEGVAQQLERIHRPGYGKPCVFVVAQENLLVDLRPVLQGYEGGRKACFVLINGSASNPAQVADSLNHYLNTVPHIAKQYVYLVVAGNDVFFNEYNLFQEDFIGKAYHLREDIFTPMVATETVQEGQGFNLDKVIDHLKKNYRFQLTIDQIEAQHAIHKYSKRGSFGVGLSMGRSFFTPKETDGYVPGSAMHYGINLYKNLGKRTQLNVSLGGGLNFPNPQDEVQAQVMDQIDVNSILDGEEQEVDISLQLKGHVYTRFTADVRYFLLNRGKWFPYAGLGLSLNQLISINGNIDTTVVIDPDDISGGLGGSARPDTDQGEVDRSIFGGPNWMAVVGVQKNLGPRWLFDASATFSPFTSESSPSNSRRTEPSIPLSVVSFNVGLTFKFIGRKTTRYQYIRLKE